MFVSLFSGIVWDCTATASISAACAAISCGVSKRMPCGAVVYAVLCGWSEWQYAQRRCMIGWIRENDTVVVLAGTEAGRIQTASPATASAHATGIHHSVRPACRRLK